MRCRIYVQMAASYLARLLFDFLRVALSPLSCEALFTSFHESGHRMYHHGLAPRLEATLRADGTSAGVHESRSRTWVNRVGRHPGCCVDADELTYDLRIVVTR